MPEDQTVTSEAAVIERPDQIIPPFAVEPPAPPDRSAKNKSKDADEVGYDVDFETPFGKIEFALEPNSVKERKDRERMEKADRDAAKAVAKAAKKTQQLLAKGKPEQLVAKSAGSKLVPILLIFLLVAGAVALAIWLFARPGEDEDAIPPEFRNTDDNVIPEPAPQGFVAKTQHRIRHAVHAGRHASREAQREQEQRFQDLTTKK